MATAERPKRAITVRRLMLWVLACALGLWVVNGLINAGSNCWPTAMERAQCGNHFKQVALALQQYAAAYGSFPPAYVPDAAGRPMHSWRVLILPFLDEDALYNAYCFDEPWNGPHNRLLRAECPRAFRLCDDHHIGAEPIHCGILAVVGPGAVFPAGGQTTRIADITDGTGRTIMLAEAARHPVEWLEPRDLDLGRMSFLVNDPNRPGLASDHRGFGPHVAFADTTVHSLPLTTTPSRLRALFTIAGGEKTLWPEPAPDPPVTLRFQVPQ